MWHWISLSIVLVCLLAWAIVKTGVDADELSERIRAHEKEGMQ